MNIKYFDITNSGNEENTLSYKEFIKNSGQDFSEFSANLNKYRMLSDLSSGRGKKILKAFLQGLHIQTNTNTVKELASEAPGIRKHIKDTGSKEILEIVDSPEFLASYVYLLSGFAIKNSSYNSRNGLNPQESVAATIIKLLEQEKIHINGFLCAHRENKEIAKHQLAQNVNLQEFQRSINLIKGIVENLGKDYQIDFFHTEGDAKGMNATFPKIFLNYLQKGELHKMSEQLDDHYATAKMMENEHLKIHSVSDHFTETQKFLDEKFGTQRKLMKTNDLYNLAESGNKFAETAYYMTLEDVQRLYGVINHIHTDIPPQKRQKLQSTNIKNTNYPEKKAIINDSIDLFFNTASVAGKALYETAFYYLRGKMNKDKNIVGLGFDRDHDIFQSESFSLGYSPEKDKKYIPLLYARRTGRPSGSKIQDLSFRQFRHF